MLAKPFKFLVKFLHCYSKVQTKWIFDPQEVAVNDNVEDTSFSNTCKENNQ